MEVPASPRHGPRLQRSSPAKNGTILRPVAKVISNAAGINTTSVSQPAAHYDSLS